MMVRQDNTGCQELNAVVGIVFNRSVKRLPGSDRSRLLNNRVGKLWLLQDWLTGWTRPERLLWLRQGTDWLTDRSLVNWLWAKEQAIGLVVREVVEVERRDVLRLLRLRLGVVVREWVVKVNGPGGLLTNGWLAKSGRLAGANTRDLVRAG